MREIKFRAWDKKDEMMFFDIQNGIKFDDESEYTFENFINKRTDDYHEWEIMQFTGLCDKNGKDVYEGDFFDMGVIDFSKNGFNGFYTENRDNEKGWDYSDEWEDGMADYVSRNEVKGNIYENNYKKYRDE